MIPPISHYTGNRHSFMELENLYFWTATIKDWNQLLLYDSMKEIVIDSLNYLSDKKLITVYAFVIMPNHLHLIWEMNGLNGKEKPVGSFLKYTAHEFLKEMNKIGISQREYEIKSIQKKREIWIPNPMAIELYSKEVINQKMNYIHTNPLGYRWNLCENPEEYYYSSAKYYATGINDFSFLKDIREIIQI